MISMIRSSVCIACIVGLSVAGWLTQYSSVAHAQGNVVLALDGMIVNNTGGGQPNWGGFGRFSYGGNTIGVSTRLGIGRYDAFTLSHTADSGSGVGVNYTIGNINSPADPFLGIVSPVTDQMFPILDLATFGANFDPTQYVAELVYRPLTGNTATQLNMTLDTSDGFTAAGLRAGEQWQWGFFDLINTFNNTEANGDLDPQGFAVARSNMDELSQAAANFNGPSFMYDASLLTEDGHLPTAQRDSTPDFNDFEGGPLPVPNGAVQIHLQTVYGGAQQTLIDNWEIKALRIVKLTPDPLEVARLDGKSGYGLRFGEPFARNTDTGIMVGGTEYFPVNTDQLQRFDEDGFLPNNAFRINTDDDTAIGGFGVWQSGVSTVFDGNTAMMEIRAKLTAPLAGQAPSVQVVAKDRDGSGTANVGDFGGEEYHFNVALNQFNESTMTTVSMPFSAAEIEQAQEFATAGDGSPDVFNLYYLGMLTNPDVGLVDLEVEYVRIMLQDQGEPGDYNDDGMVNAADYTTWRNHLGETFPLDNEVAGTTPGQVTPEDYDAWKSRFGNGTLGVGGGSAVPEPGTVVLAMFGMGLLAVFRRTS
jgi:hypothetical protein